MRYGALATSFCTSAGRTPGLLELALGVVSLAITLLLASWSSWVPRVALLLGQTSPLAGVATISISIAALLPPTVLMGATLPLLVKFLVRITPVAIG